MDQLELEAHQFVQEKAQEYEVLPSYDFLYSYFAS